jgi:predicted Rossmann fold nucleotide-binding protein DprA/Smf involved in DNA uptake
MPQPIDDLVVRAKLDAAVINATLTILEIQGVAKNVGGGKWVRA